MGFFLGLVIVVIVGGDVKNFVVVLFLMLLGMVGLFNVFGLGGLLNNFLLVVIGNIIIVFS